jgi:uncharacterized protein
VDDVSFKMKNEAQYWIKKLDLEVHPEGGFFRQTYVSDLRIAREALATGFSGARPASTAIYFLLNGREFSAFHRLRSDEMWHFYAGRPAAVHIIDQNGEYRRILLGTNFDAGQVPQAVVKAGCWFASELVEQNSCALMGCTVAPGFDFEDFELAKRSELTRQFPQHRALIERLTRE